MTRANPDNNPAPEAPGPDGGPQAADGAQTLPAEMLSEVQRQREEYLEQLQRTQAEFANYQKRARAQAEQDRQYAVAGLAADLLPVLDNFERALEAARSSGATSLAEGLGMVQRQLLAALAKHGIEPIEALGQPFDPTQHEAILHQPHEDQPEGTVVGEMEKGYRMRDRILRPTKVAVSRKP